MKKLILITGIVLLFSSSIFARFNSIDPKADKYPSISPYAYCANNPIRNIDPDGQEIVVTGSASQRQTILSNLQQLTNDKLALRSNGTMIISRMGGENSGSYLKEGNSLIRFHNQKGAGSHTVTISPSSGRNRTLTSAGANVVGGNPGPGANSDVQFNPSLNTAGVDVTGSRTRPPSIGLAHELIHAKINASGTRDNTKTNLKDPDTGRRGVLSKTEVATRAEENKIRKEQNVTLRKEPIK